MRAPNVFISYRRDDTAGSAGRLSDDLGDRIGAEHVFIDVKIRAGDDYEQHIEHVLDTCDAVLVVIGPHWATDGRLQDPADLLRREIERALQRDDVTVVPVLVQRAEMPEASTLPDGLRPLARRNASELTNRSWARDIDQLCSDIFDGADALAPVLTGARAAAWMVAAGAAGAVLAGLFTNSLAAQRDTGVDWPIRLIVYSAERGLIWAFAGAFALGAASWVLRRDRAGVVGWAIIGAGFGAAAGALGGAAFMAMTDGAQLHDNALRHGVSTAITGVVVGAAVARVVSAESMAYQLAGLVGGLLGAILALRVDEPRAGMSEGGLFLLLEAATVLGAIVVAALALAPEGQPRRGARVQVPG